jgi:hypothetical protein
MKAKLFAAIALPCFASYAVAQNFNSPRFEDRSVKIQVPELGAHLPREAVGNQAAIDRARGTLGTGGTNLSLSDRLYLLSTHRGGNYLTSVNVRPIYWGTSWSNPTFVGDKASNIQTFLGGLYGAGYWNTVGEYITTAKINVLPAITDTTAASGIDAATILSEVCATIAAKGLKPTVNDYYPVYVDTPHVKGNSCAYHSYGTCSGTVVQFGFHSNFDGEVADATGRGCSAGSTPTVSQGANSLVNATAHELWETVTDPRGNYLYDSFGSEGSDKCAWILSTVGAWNIQAEWSNAAFTAGSGAPNSSGQKACVWSR